MPLIVGIDEVGRGSWAGPLVAGAVLLDQPMSGLRDSKLLSHAQRQGLLKHIYKSALWYNTAWVRPEEIDSIGMTASVDLAFRRVIKTLQQDFDEIIIDGTINYLRDMPKTIALVRADTVVPSVSAASIVAKEARDAYMRHQALRYPEYGFENHVGYGTERHREAIMRFGVTEIHRRSFKPIREALLREGR